MGRLEYMQGGPLGIVLFRADILSIHPVMPGDAICSLYAKCRGTLSVKTEPTSGVRTGAFNSDGNAFRFTDVIHPSAPLFARRIECFDTLSFGINAPCDLRRSFFCRKDDPSMLLSSLSGDICITLRGNADFNPDGTIKLNPGKSDIIICSLTGDSAAGFPGVPPTYDEIYEAVLANADPRINSPELRDIVNRTCRGGVLHTFADCTYNTEEQYDAVRTLCKARLFARARDVIEFMHRVYGFLGHLPFIYGEKPQSDPFPAIRNSYLALALRDYYQASKDKRFVRRLLPDVAESMSAILGYAKNGRLPHLGNEGVNGKDLFLPSERSEALFISAAKAVLQMSEEVRVRICCGAGLRSVTESREKSHDSYIRPTRTLHTVCEECERDGVCYLGKGGRFLCPQCYIKQNKNTPCR